MARAITTIQGTPKIWALPIPAKGRAALKTVVSLAARRDNPRTAVMAPSVTMKAGRRKNAIRLPLTAPSARPASRPHGIARADAGPSDMDTAVTADTARTEPTARSMPPVRMTKVSPVASTMLIEACCITIEMFRALRNLPVANSNPMQIRISTGSMPAIWMIVLMFCLRVAAAAAVSWATRVSAPIVFMEHMGELPPGFFFALRRKRRLELDAGGERHDVLLGYRGAAG